MTQDLPELDARVSNIIAAAWSSNTLSVRNSQWRLFLQFCQDRALVPLPVEITSVVRFLAFLEARGYKFNTINNYLSAVINLQKFYGFFCDIRSTFLMQMVISGLKNRLGNSTIPKRPLDVNQLHLIYLLYHRSPINDACWLALIICFRTLLRKSNVVPDNSTSHVLLRRDVTFYHDHVLFHVNTTKTRKKGEEKLLIPVYRTDRTCFCVKTLLYNHFSNFPAQPDSPLLLKHSPAGLVPLLYKDVLRFLKEGVKLIGLSDVHFGLHSMRRSGAMFLQSIGVPLYEIQLLGDWKSMAVLFYLASTFDRKVSIQNLVVNALK